jgi:cytochrome c-type biogenesis protein CcmH
MFLLIPAAALWAQQQSPEEQVRAIAAGLRCVVCQNLSVADSPSEMAQQMRGSIREQLQQGKTPEEINAYFVSKYGEWVLLAPTPQGFSLLLWVLPYATVILGIVLVIFVARRWVRKKQEAPPIAVDQTLIERVRQEIAEGKSPQVDKEVEGPRSALQQEQARLYDDLRELDFDFQAGKLSETDYQYLHRELELQAATALKQIESLPPPHSRGRAAASRTEHTQTEKKSSETAKVSGRSWQVALGGAFLLFFGIAVGVYLTKSVRPRSSEQDTITGGFLTGTGPGGMTAGSGNNVSTLLGQGRAAFERQDWPKAIEAFKATLAIDPNQAEAHTYMGLILAQAGHADGALLAFERSLATNPNFPLALWGKGMILYQDKKDFSAARETLEKLLNLMPAGAERDEVRKTVAELAKLGGRKQAGVKTAAAGSASKQIQGTVSIDPRFKTNVDNHSVLFIIVRSASSSGGPPLAVKRISGPVFPLSYSLGPEDVMMAGMPFTGKVVVSVRLDQDGNVATQEAGNLTGAYKQNPVEVGSKKVDIVMDRRT